MKPYAKAQTIPLEGLRDRRRKLTDEQREEIRAKYAQGNISAQRLANMYNCSRALVQIIVNPERARKTAERIKSHWREYYERRGKEAHAEAVRKTREYKYKLFKKRARNAPDSAPRATPAQPAPQGGE